MFNLTRARDRTITTTAVAAHLFTIFTHTYLPFDGSGNPSSDHWIWGVGLPAAEHFNETAGPGCNVCSIKLYNMTGGASENI